MGTPRDDDPGRKAARGRRDRSHWPVLLIAALMLAISAWVAIQLNHAPGSIDSARYERFRTGLTA